MTHYETLDVDQNATADDIKRAYRKKSSESHPDAGGSKADFQKVIRAYETLRDPEARDRYDRTGQDKDNENRSFSPEESIALSAIDKAMAKLESSMVWTEDPFKIAREAIENTKGGLLKEVSSLKSTKTKLEKRLSKFEKSNHSTPNKAGKTLVVKWMLTGLDQLGRLIEQTEQNARHHEGALEVIEHLEMPPEATATSYATSTLHWEDDGKKYYRTLLQELQSYPGRKKT